MNSIEICNRYLNTNIDWSKLKKVYDYKNNKNCNMNVKQTKISNIVQDGNKNKLYYRGIDVDEIVKNNTTKGYAFEEGIYLLLFGSLPTKEQLKKFSQLLFDLRNDFFESSKTHSEMSSKNMMINLERNILLCYNDDSLSENSSFQNVFRQSLELIAKMPIIVLNSYYEYNQKYLHKKNSLNIPQKLMSTSEYILYLLHGPDNYSKLDVEALDIILLIQAEHGGNNSTYTNYIVSTSYTDTYSSVIASIASLKGNRHGGAILKVSDMIKDLIKSSSDLKTENIEKYFNDILNKNAFDKTGLIYGIGHAVYNGEDPRATIMKSYAFKLANEKNKSEQYKTYEEAGNIAIKLLSSKVNNNKKICINVDFYSGLAYSLLGIPTDLFTSMFVISRIVGWSSHRLETIINNEKLVRPTYNYIGKYEKYVDIEKR